MAHTAQKAADEIDQLREEIKRLRKSAEDWHDLAVVAESRTETLLLDYGLLSADYRDLEEDNRRLRLDAERYRRLREIDRPVAWGKLLDIETSALRYSAIKWLPHRIDDAVDDLRGEAE